MTKQVVRFTSTQWETVEIPLMEPPDLEGDDITEEDRSRALETYERFKPIGLEVRRVNRSTRNGWDREFARILAEDQKIRGPGASDDLGLHMDTIERLDEFNAQVVKTALVKIKALIVGDVDVSEVPQAEALELIAECGLSGYVSKACRRCQAPTVTQGEA